MKFNLKPLLAYVPMFLFLSVILFLNHAFADTATSTAIAVDPNAPAFGPSLLGVISAIKIGTISAILLALSKVLQSDFVSGFVGGALSHTAVSWINTIVAVVIACAATMAQPGVPWYVGVVEGIVSGLASSGFLSHIGLVPPTPPAS